jgi:hypothetical protein
MSTTPPDDPNGTPGNPPPPSGPDYGAPPPPPPAGGYGTPPPAGGYGYPPSDGGYSAPPDGDDGKPWSIGNALGYGFEKFSANLGQIVLATILLLIASVVAIAISVPIRTGVDNGTFFTSELGSAIAQIIITFLTWIVQAAIIRGALDITEGRRFQVSNLFSRLNIGNVLLAAFLVSVITFVGTLLCILPGIVAWFLLLFTPFFVVDKDMPAIEAIQASFRLTVANLGNMILWVVVGGIVYLVGYCVLCIGILVTAPVVLIGATYTYKKFSGQPVAP